MFNLFLFYDLDISPFQNSGEIKNSLDMEFLKANAIKNDELNRLPIFNPTIDSSKRTFIDSYFVDITINGFRVKSRFIEIKNTELLTSSNVCSVLLNYFHRHFIIKNDCASTENAQGYYNYRLKKMIEIMEERNFYDLSPFPFELPLNTKIYDYQRNNINWMLKLETNPRYEQFTSERLIHFPDNRIFNVDVSSFINPQSIPKILFKGGIIADDTGIGKTLQMLTLCALRPMPTLVLVPSHMREHWIEEISKHFRCPLELEITIFEEFNKSMLKNKRRLIVDELDRLYTNRDFSQLYSDICSTKLEFKWGMTFTPFCGKSSMYHIIRYLTDLNINWTDCEKITYYDKLYISLFKRNIKENIQDELLLPEIKFFNHPLDFNDHEKSIYESERIAKRNSDEMALRLYCCDITLKYESSTPLTEEQYRAVHLKNLQDQFNDEQNRFVILKEKLQMIIKELAIRPNEELLQNKNHYENLVSEREKIVKDRHRSFELYSAILNNEKECSICYMEIEGSYSIMKECPHYFHETCLKAWVARNKICPMCRNPNADFYVLGHNSTSNPYSTKIMKMLEIIKSTSEQIIIFSQFDNIISKIKNILAIEGIDSLLFSDENVKRFKNKESKIIILSYTKVCGLDMSYCNNIIIFEPIKGEGNYVLDNERQAVGRIQRINQKNVCLVHRLYIKDTIEETIYSGLF